MLTRRRFLVLFPAFAVPAIAAPAQSFTSLPFKKKRPIAPPAPVFVYFGTDTKKGVSKGIYQSRFDPKTGQLTTPILAAATARPSFLALSPPRNGPRFVYAVNAVNDPAATVTTFVLDPNTGALRQVGQVPSGSAGPCYISVDSTGRSAFVANCMGSSISSYRILPDGTLSQPVDQIDFKDHKHNRFLLVNDLGTDHISVFVINHDTGHLTTSEPHLFTNDRPGSGPRHVVFHPNGRWVYGINEMESTVDHYLWTATRFSNAPQGLLVNTNTPIKTIAQDFPAEKNTAAEVAVSPDGKFLYASNRGEDSLVVFSVSSKDGALTLIQRIACGGKVPRHFTLDPTAQWLLCGNQDSASITVFRRDSATGKLTGPTQTITVDSPMFTLFA